MVRYTRVKGISWWNRYSIGGWGILASGIFGLGLAISGAVKAFAKFEYQMLYVKNLAQLSSTAYQNLSNHIRRIARDSIHTTQQLAKLAVEMAKAGLSGDQIDRAIKPTANFAVANFIEPGEAARIAINTLNQFGMGIDRIKEVTGTLTCLLYTSPSPRDRQKSRMPSSA